MPSPIRLEQLMMVEVLQFTLVEGFNMFGIFNLFFISEKEKKARRQYLDNTYVDSLGKRRVKPHQFSEKEREMARKIVAYHEAERQGRDCKGSKDSDHHSSDSDSNCDSHSNDD